MIATAQLNSSPSWFCLRSQAKREHIAAANLRERVAVEVFAPRLRVAQTTGRGFVGTVAEALFPGYLFARFAYPRQVRHVISTSGVTGLVAFGGPPPPVANDVIDFLRDQVAQADRMAIAPVFAAGSWVKIVSGCFHHAEGRVLHFDPRTERVRLLLGLLGREVQVSLEAHRVANTTEPLAHYPLGLIARDPGASSSERRAS